MVTSDVFMFRLQVAIGSCWTEEEGEWDSSNPTMQLHIPFCWRTQPPACNWLWLRLNGHLTFGLLGRTNLSAYHKLQNHTDVHASSVGCRRGKEIRVLSVDFQVLRTQNVSSERPPNGKWVDVGINSPSDGIRIIASERHSSARFRRRSSGRPFGRARGYGGRGLAGRQSWSCGSGKDVAR